MLDHTRFPPFLYFTVSARPHAYARPLPPLPRPPKALVRERVDDWRSPAGLCAKLGKTLVELTGDHTPDMRALQRADIIVATPEKWDGVSRGWASRAYVTKVCRQGGGA